MMCLSSRRREGRGTNRIHNFRRISSRREGQGTSRIHTFRHSSGRRREGGSLGGEPVVLHHVLALCDMNLCEMNLAL